MNRLRSLLQLTLLSALLLTAGTAVAQQLVQYEYWFDQAFSRRQTVALSGNMATIDAALDTRQLNDGMHTFHLRVKQSDGAYSPVTSSMFFKFKAREGDVLEYWFDDDIDAQSTVNLSGDTIAQTVVLDLADNERFPVGLHRLNYRVAANGSNYSPVYGDNIMKTTTGDVCRLEYWFDDDFDLRAIADMAPIELMDDYSLLLDLSDDTRFPKGQHRLNMRVMADDGHYSPVYATNVLKTLAGNAYRLEYWFDDDYDSHSTMDMDPLMFMDDYEMELDLRNRTAFPKGQHTLNLRVVTDKGYHSPVYGSWVLDVAAGQPNALEYWIDDNYAGSQEIGGHQDESLVLHDTQLDLSHVSPGYHRLNVRATSGSHFTNSPVTTIPLMVKSRYYADPQSLTVDSYSLSVDGGTPQYFPIHPRSSSVIVPYTLDARSLADGTHTVAMQFSNSLDLWSASAEGTFKHQAPAAPKLTLTLEEKNGVVTLKHNSVPNDIQSRILRVDAGGAKAIVADNTSSMYPNTVTATDLPPVGTFTYRAVAAYTDAAGKRQTIQSAEVPVTITTSAQKPKYVDLVVEKTMQGVNAYHMPIDVIEADVHFSDGVVIDAKYPGIYFHRTNVEVGTELDVWMENGYYASKPCHIKVKDEKENRIKLEVFYDESIKERAIDNSQYELAFVGGRQPWVLPQEFGFRLKNISNLDWSGKVRVRAISKKEYENPPTPKTLENSLPTSALVGTGNVASLNTNPYATTSETIEIEKEFAVNLLKGGEQDYQVTFDDLPDNVDPEEYYFVFESIRHNAKGAELEKLICPSEDFDNPLLQQMPGTGKAGLELDDEIIACTDVVMGIMDKGVEFAGLFGKKELTKEDMKTVKRWMKERGKSWDMVVVSLEAGGLALDELQQWWNPDEYKPPITKQFRKDMAESAKDLKSAKKYIKYVKDFFELWDAYTERNNLSEQTDRVTLALELMKMTAEETVLRNNPFAKLLDTYFDVGSTMAKAIQETIGKTYFDAFVVDNLKNNQRPLTYTDPTNCNNKIDFAIKVRKNNWNKAFFDFDGPEMTKCFQRIVIHASSYETGDQVAHFEYTPIANDKEVVLKQIKYQGGDDHWGDLVDGFPLKRLWMEVHWSNGRVSLYPLNQLKVETMSVPYKVTLILQSGSSSLDHIADIIAIPND